MDADNYLPMPSLTSLTLNPERGGCGTILSAALLHILPQLYPSLQHLTLRAHLPAGTVWSQLNCSAFSQLTHLTIISSRPMAWTDIIPCNKLQHVHVEHDYIYFQPHNSPEALNDCNMWMRQTQVPITSLHLRKHELSADAMLPQLQSLAAAQFYNTLETLTLTCIHLNDTAAQHLCAHPMPQLKELTVGSSDIPFSTICDLIHIYSHLMSLSLGASTFHVPFVQSHAAACTVRARWRRLYLYWRLYRTRLLPNTHDRVSDGMVRHWLRTTDLYSPERVMPQSIASIYSMVQHIRSGFQLHFRSPY